MHLLIYWRIASLTNARCHDRSVIAVPTVCSAALVQVLVGEGWARHLHSSKHKVMLPNSFSEGQRTWDSGQQILTGHRYSWNFAGRLSDPALRVCNIITTVQQNDDYQQNHHGHRHT